MGNSLRCCLACVLPCGALDVIRIVHLNGHVEEVSHPTLVKQVIHSNPNHVLTKPCSQGLGRTILILSPNSELKRGHIYFLIPSSAVPNYKSAHHKKKPRASEKFSIRGKKVAHRDRHQAGRLGIWRPNLESIREDGNALQFRCQVS